MFNASRVSLVRGISVDEVSCDFGIQNRMTLSWYLKWGRGFVDARTEVTYDIGAEPPAPVQLVSPRLGVLSWRGDAGRPGDKYPFDIMDGVCIQPQRNGGTNPIRFTNSSVTVAAHA